MAGLPLAPILTTGIGESNAKGASDTGKLA